MTVCERGRSQREVGVEPGRGEEPGREVGVDPGSGRSQGVEQRRKGEEPEREGWE